MILRRVIAHFRKQEWTAIFLDFIIVVIGVFVGLQVNNWNEAQTYARLGRDYTKRLVRDLQQDLVIIRSEIAYYSAVLESVQLADALLKADDSDPRALVVNAYRASELSYSAPVSATWDEIVSTGHLDLLPEGAAESGLSQYYAFDLAQDVYQRGVESGYRRAVRRVIPINIQIAMRASCSDVRDDSGVIVGFAEKCELNVDPADLKDVAAALRSDPAVAAELRLQYSFAISSVLNIGVQRSALEQALTALGAAPQAAEWSAP